MQHINIFIQIIIYVNVLFCIITLSRYLISKIAQSIKLKIGILQSFVFIFI